MTTTSSVEDVKVSSIWDATASRRLRVAIVGLQGDEELAKRVEQELAGAAWVSRAKADSASGRVLLEYAGPAPFSPEWLTGVGWRPIPAVRRRDEGAGGRLLRLLSRLPPRALDGVRQIGQAVEGWLGPPRREVSQTAAATDLPDDAHARAPADVLALLGTSEEGLSVAEAAERTARYGPNLPATVEPRGPLRVLLVQVSNLPTALLLGAAVVSLALGDVTDTVVILAVIGLNVMIGYRIERKSERLLAAWRRMDAGDVQVLRSGAVQRIASPDLVPGDIVHLRGGDVVAADARVLAADRLACDEAALTGESEPQEKTAKSVESQAPLAERRSMVYAGTAVASGQGRAVIVATGGATQMARVRQLISDVEEPRTPLDLHMEMLVRRTTGVGVAAAGVMFGLGWLRGRPLAGLLRGAVALGVAAIPEGLPVVATASLVRSMSRLRSRGVIVRRLASAEVLGGVTVVCIDKTGTITENEMQVAALFVDGRSWAPADVRAGGDLPANRLAWTLAAAVLNSEVYFDNGAGGCTIGSGTERALVKAARDAGIDIPALLRTYPRQRLHERSDGTHYVISVHDGPAGQVAFVKGAPEQVVSLCQSDGGRLLDESRRQEILAANHHLAAAGQRMIAVAWRPRAIGSNRAARDWELIGLVGLQDPVRAGAAHAIAAAREAGIRTLILTGDQQATAASVARTVGIPGEVIDGATFVAAMVKDENDPAAAGTLRRAAGFSRVTPADKVAIVKALRARGEIVAMAGDGINDAPALKVADVGIAVGTRASDLARQTADLVLVGTDLRVILAAVGEGRIVQDNLRRSARYLLATNLSEVALMIGGALLGAEPMTASQLLWINLITDTLPALALALEPGNPYVLARPPTAPGQPLLSQHDWRTLMRDGGAMGALGAGAFLLGGNGAAFGALVGAQLGYVLRCRADDAPAGRTFGLLVGTSVAMQLAALVIPPLRGVLGIAGSPLIPIVGLAAGFSAPVLVSARQVSSLFPQSFRKGALA